VNMVKNLRGKFWQAGRLLDSRGGLCSELVWRCKFGLSDCIILIGVLLCMPWHSLRTFMNVHGPSIPSPTAMLFSVRTSAGRNILSHHSICMQISQTYK
jgi:hypothetical protein